METPSTSPTPSPVRRRSWPRRLLNRLEVDQAVFYSVVLRVWQLVAGLGTATLMTICFPPRVQGFYYTFSNLIALQSFFELGLTMVVVHFCSHEWGRLRLEAGRIVGDELARCRLVSFGRWLLTWYGVAACLFVLVVGVAGQAFLARNDDPTIVWREPWLVLVFFSGGLLATVPAIAILEGCNQVRALSIYRLIQAILASLAVWLMMATGGSLWTAVVAAGVRLGCDLVFLGGWYRRFWSVFLQPPQGIRVDWRTEVWPLQWRVGLLGVVAYFAFNLYVPVLFEYQGAEVAGQFGLTWTVVCAIQAAALAWVQTRAPHFGTLIQSRQFAELDRIFFRVQLLAVVAYVAASATFWLLLAGIHAQGIPLAKRVLTPGETAWLLVGAGVQVVGACQAIYVRSHKREPFLLVGVVSSLLMGLGVWHLGRLYGPLGAGVTMVAVSTLVMFPGHFWILQAVRRENRSLDPPPPTGN